jgi:hypothetical protein
MSRRPTDQCTNCGGFGNTLSDCPLPRPGDEPKQRRGHGAGAYLGGVIDRESLRDRCCIDSITGCWLWRLSHSQGAPRVHVRMLNGRSKVMRGRAAAWYFRSGEVVPSGMVAFATPNCSSAECVNPDHVRIGARSAWGAWMAERGVFKDQPRRIVANRANAAKRRKLTDEQVEAIRASTDSLREVAAAHAVSINTVSAIRSGRLHKQRTEIAGASAFTWRPA